MNSRYTALILTLVLALSFAFSGSAVFAAKKKKLISIAIIPHVRTTIDENGNEKRDPALVKLRQVIGGLDHVQIILSPKSVNQLFSQLAKLKAGGYEINHLIIGGHGDGKQGNYPGVKLDDFTIDPTSIDLKTMDTRADSYRKSADRKRRENAGDFDINKQLDLEKGYRDNAAFVRNADGVMSKNGIIQLYNCNTVASSTGIKFVTDLGNLLFGDKPGNIIASKTNVDVYQYGPERQALDSFAKNLQDPMGIRRVLAYLMGTDKDKLNANEFYAQGDWLSVPINGGAEDLDGSDVSDAGGGAIPDKSFLDALSDNLSDGDPPAKDPTDTKPGDLPSEDDPPVTQSCPKNTVKLNDEAGKTQCVPCAELYGDFNVALEAGEKDYAQSLLSFASTCGWIAEGTEKIENYDSCPDNTVRLSDDTNKIYCVPCDELYGDFNAALDSNEKAYAQSLLDVAQNCAWTAAGQEKLHNARDCPGNTVKLSDSNNNIECVPCDDLYTDFSAALSGNDFEYAQSLADLAPNCAWATAANQQVKDAKESCPDNTVKLMDSSGQNECAPCNEIYTEFKGALSSDDREYAQMLADLGVSCYWSAQAYEALAAPQSCPENTVKLSDNSNQTECVPCITLHGDFTAAINQGDNNYAQSLLELASVCDWSRAVAQEMQDRNNQAAYDQDCERQLPGSFAVIQGDRYICHCRSDMITLNGPNGSSCQNCEQIRGYVESALKNNDLDTARGLVAGAQSCDWYNQALQVIAEIEQQINTPTTQQPPTTQYPPITRQPPKTNNPPKATPPKPSHSSGDYCKGHHLLCKRYSTEYDYPNTALDKNRDWKCDICGKRFMVGPKETAPGLRGAQRGDVSCRQK